MKITELAQKQENPSHKRGHSSIQYGGSNLLETAIHSIFALVKHTLYVLVTHVHDVVHGEADENDEAD